MTVSPARLTLTDGGVETALIFHEGLELPCFAAYPLVATEAGEAALRRWFAPFLALAAARGTGLALSAPTWRASADWGARLGHDAAALHALNRASVDLVDALRHEHGGGHATPWLVEGVVGPRVDGAPGAAAMTPDEAARYHAPQLRAFADSPADQVVALTLAYADEATGIVRAAQELGLHVVISFTVETDGRLPDGEALGAAIRRVDTATDGAAAAFMVNCAHPAHLDGALAAAEPDWLGRIGGLRLNASTRSHAELDEADDLDTGDVDDLAARHVALAGRLPALRTVGGCCGTDVRHVAAICDALLAR